MNCMLCECYGLDVGCNSRNSDAGALTPNATVLGGRAFGRELGLGEVMRVKPP